ncbi:MAG: hypothetical protein NC489_24070 [Ruminococcus flavefaciens]|nr:hypothetical protein [Ruminococcus flavefaciens]
MEIDIIIDTLTDCLVCAETGAKMIDWHTLYIDSYGAVALINKYFKVGE